MTLPTRRFANDDDAAQHWLRLLRDGDDDQKIQAREQLATIFERRGMFEEATELLISNLHDGIRNADIFRWLARLYRNQSQEVLAMQAAAEAAKYMVPPPRQVVEPTTAMMPMQPPARSRVRAEPSAPPAPHPAPITQPRSTLRTLAIGCIAVIGGLCLLGAIGSLARPSSTQTASPAMSAPQPSGNTPTPQAAAAAKPEPTQRPPTATPVPPTAAPTPAIPPGINDPVVGGDIALVVGGVRFLPAIGYSKPEAGKEYVIVTIGLKNVGKRDQSYNSFNFNLQDKSGNIRRQSFVVGLDTPLHDGSLAPNGTVAGTIPFEVAQGDRDLTLVWEPSCFFCDKVRVRLESTH